MVNAAAPPDEFFTRVTKFILGGDDIIAGEDSAGTWPDFAKVLTFQPSQNAWKVRDVPVTQPRFGIDVQDWRGDKAALGNKTYYVHWRAEKQRNASIFNSGAFRSSNVWVNGLARAAPANCYGAAMFLPTTGSLGGKLQVLAVTYSGPNMRIQRASYDEFLLGPPVWTELSVAGDMNIGDELGEIPSVYFSRDGSKGSYVAATGLNNTYENAVVDIEISINDSCSTSTGVRTIHGPWQRTYSKNFSTGGGSNVTIYTDSQGHSIGYGIANLSDGWFKQEANFRYPIGADYNDEGERIFVELDYFENHTETYSYSNIQLVDSGVSGTPGSASDTLEVTASSRVDTRIDYSGTRMRVNLYIGGVLVDTIAERRFTGSFSNLGSGTDYETDLTARDLDFPPQGMNFEWDVPPVNGWTNGSTTSVSPTTIFNNNYYKRSPGIILLVDARYGVACYGAADIKSGSWDFSDIDPSGPQYTDVYEAHDNVGSGIEINKTLATTLPDDWRPAADVTTDSNLTAAQIILGFSTGIDSEDVDVEIEFLYDIGTLPTRYSEVGAETTTHMVTAHHKRGMVVQLDQGSQARTETDLNKTTYATGDANLPDLLDSTNFANSTNSWNTKV